MIDTVNLAPLPPAEFVEYFKNQNPESRKVPPGKYLGKDARRYIELTNRCPECLDGEIEEKTSSDFHNPASCKTCNAAFAVYRITGNKISSVRREANYQSHLS